MQSSDYVPGVSGWKMENKTIELNGGPWGSTKIGDLSEAPKIEYVAAGIGIGIDAHIIVDAGNFSINPEPVKSDVMKAIESGDAKTILDALCSTISKTKLSAELQSKISAMDSIRSAVREELAKAMRPGGMLHRK